MIVSLTSMCNVKIDQFCIDYMLICGTNFSYIGVNVGYKICKLVLNCNCIKGEVSQIN